MGDEEKEAPTAATGGPADNDRRIQKIEQMLNDNEVLRKTLRKYSICGILALLFVLFIFVYRLYDYGRNYDTDALVAALQVQAEENLVPEAEALVAELQDGLVADFGEKCMIELKNEMPNIQTEVGEMGGRLFDMSQKYVEERLVETMANSFEESEKELQEIFPEFNSAELEGNLNEASAFFIEELGLVLDAKLGKVSGSVEGLKSAVTRVGETSGIKELEGMAPEAVEEMLLDAIMDLVIYEIKPELGLIPVSPAEGKK